MIHSKSVIGILLAFCGLNAAAETNLAPGLVYFNGSESLSGRLVFQVERGSRETTTNNEKAASIYEFDLARNALRKITDSPQGLFVFSDNEGMCVVSYSLMGLEQKSVTNVFIYSDSLHLEHTAQLEGTPENTCIVGHHVFFIIRKKLHKRIVDLDFDNQTQRLVELPDASAWAHFSYDNMSAAEDKTNVLRFEYIKSGSRLTDGKDYKNGYYDFSVTTGEYKWSSVQNRPPAQFQSFDGKYIFFKGSGAPIEGFDLVSSPRNALDTEGGEVDRKDVKLLASFSRLGGIVGNHYSLVCMSPDHKYALVKLTASAKKMVAKPAPHDSESLELYGMVNTYYLIDVKNGKKRVLIEDEVFRKTSGLMSEVRWLPGSK
jgi:hypothetical protein